MACSANGQDESNSTMWLAIRAGKMELSPRKKNFPVRHIINPLLTKLVRSRWLDIGLDLFVRVYGPRLSLSINTQKKNLTNIQPSWPHSWSITHIIWLAPQAAKITQTVRCDCLPERLSHLARWGLPWGLLIQNDWWLLVFLNSCGIVWMENIREL